MLLPERQLPWILTSLAEAILRAGCTQSEGILRLSADADAVQTLKARCEQWQTLLRPVGELRSDPHAPVIPFECSDPHVLAGVLKLWLRELRESLVPPQLYEQCIAAFSDAERCRALLESLPSVQRASLTYPCAFCSCSRCRRTPSAAKWTPRTSRLSWRRTFCDGLQTHRARWPPMPRGPSKTHAEKCILLQI